MNKCNVQFVCTGCKETCEFYADGEVCDIAKPYHNGCLHYDGCGNCYSKQAQIKALIDEGFEIKEVSE